MVTPIQPGTLIAGFRIESHRKRATRTDTYAARGLDGQAVLLRILDSARAKPALSAGDFQAEGERILKHLRVPLPKMLAAGTTAWGTGGDARLLYYTATQWIDGETLDESMAKNTPWISRALGEVAMVSSALYIAHKEIGLVHGNVSPQNIFVVPEEDFDIRLLDVEVSTLFGIDSEDIKATPTFRAPEQLRGERIDHRADMYSLGLVLYYSATGRHPFAAEDGAAPGPARCRMAAMSASPRDMTEICGPKAAPVWEFIKQACAKSPADRFPTWFEFAQRFSAVSAAYINDPATDAPLQAVAKEAYEVLLREVERRENRGPASGMAVKPLSSPPPSDESSIQAPRSDKVDAGKLSDEPATPREPDTQPSAGPRLLLPREEITAANPPETPSAAGPLLVIEPPVEPAPVLEPLTAPAAPDARPPSKSQPPSLGAYRALTSRAFALSIVAMLLGAMVSLGFSWSRPRSFGEAVSVSRPAIPFPVWVPVTSSPPPPPVTTSPPPTPTPTPPPPSLLPAEPIRTRPFTGPSANQRMERTSAARTQESRVEPKDGTRCGLPAYMKCKSQLD